MTLAPFKLEQFFAQYEFSAQYLLCSSDCESMSIHELLSLEPTAVEAFQQQWLGYTETSGSPELRQEITQLYQHITPDHILVHAGAEEAIFIFMNTVLKSGDHIIVHFPCYQSLMEIAKSMGCQVSPWPTHEADGWELNLDLLPQMIRPNTKAIVVNCPHNPTGYLMSHGKFEALVAIARQHNLLLFSDEVYRFLERQDEDTLPAACDLYENAVSLGVLSKAYGLPGLRIGWIAARNPQIYQAMAAFKHYTSICNSAPSEFLATLALRRRQSIIDRNRAIIAVNLEVCDRVFARYSDYFNWRRPQAGSTAFPSLTLDMNIEDFCIDLVKRQGVLLLPGTYFDYGDQHFRLGLGRKNLPTCLDQLETYLKFRQRPGFFKKPGP